MPQSIEAWSQQQWGVFVTVLAAGALAALLARPVARARIDLRARVGRHVVPSALAALYPPTALPVIPGAGRTPQEQQLIDDVAAHLAAGPGSLTSLREVGQGSIDPDDIGDRADEEIRAEIGEAFDAALEAFRIAVEPAMRRARLWTLQGGETYAENALRVWHLIENTAEYPMVPTS